MSTSTSTPLPAAPDEVVTRAHLRLVDVAAGRIALITLDNGRNFLFDCGEGATRQMVKANINPADVPWVFLTHLHFDHICGLPFFQPAFAPGQR